ncbi:hypothetical protein QFC19_001742 [Naganishia cerealis]|uniref:Uncharacterized protein n=1 Tax=Naganishia cerealis TaxID=610337 RepID=A0ACC2WG82_9TREE|nr:hypothetical protein QFC19_001742 [Naganishia cerealis]
MEDKDDPTALWAAHSRPPEWRIRPEAHWSRATIPKAKLSHFDKLLKYAWQITMIIDVSLTGLVSRSGARLQSLQESLQDLKGKWDLHYCQPLKEIREVIWQDWRGSHKSGIESLEAFKRVMAQDSHIFDSNDVVNAIGSVESALQTQEASREGPTGGDGVRSDFFRNRLVLFRNCYKEACEEVKFVLWLQEINHKSQFLQVRLNNDALRDSLFRACTPSMEDSLKGNGLSSEECGKLAAVFKEQLGFYGRELERRVTASFTPDPSIDTSLPQNYIAQFPRNIVTTQNPPDENYVAHTLRTMENFFSRLGTYVQRNTASNNLSISREGSVIAHSSGAVTQDYLDECETPLSNFSSLVDARLASSASEADKAILRDLLDVCSGYTEIAEYHSEQTCDGFI